MMMSVCHRGGCWLISYLVPLLICACRRLAAQKAILPLGTVLYVLYVAVADCDLADFDLTGCALADCDRTGCAGRGTRLSSAWRYP
jgi:hypothetical protein